MENTKGYFTAKGKIWGLNEKEPMENSAVRMLSFGLQMSKDNSLFMQVGEWKNTTLNIKIKGEGMDKPEEVNEQDAIDEVKRTFKDGDSVFINARVQVDTFRKKLTFLVNQIYIEKDPIDFDAKDFVETNELNQVVVVTEKPENRKVKVGITSYKGEMVEEELELNDNDIKDYFDENVKVGDLIKLEISVKRTPHYIDGVEDAPVVKERKTLKGKSVHTGGGKGYRKADSYIESMEVTDVDLEKVEKQKYNRNEIREALQLTEDIQTKKEQNSTPSDKTNHSAPSKAIDDEDIPF